MRERDDRGALEDALVENVVRADLSPIEEARCLRLLIDDLGASPTRLAEQLPGRSRPDLANTLRLLDLPDEVVDLVDAGTLSKGHSKVLLSITDAAARVGLAGRAAREGWSVRELEQRARAGRTPAAVTRSAVPAEHREAARRLAAALGEHLPGSRVAATREGAALHVPAQHLPHLEALFDVASTDG